MLWFFMLVMLTALGAVIAAGALAPDRNFALRVVGVLFALSILVVLAVLLWKQAIVALAIAAVCSLAVGVMFQKVDPSKAIGGAITAFVLMFLFSWLALQMADPLLFGRESGLSQWLQRAFHDFHHLGKGDVQTPGFLAALGAACLLAACCLDGWAKAITAFIGGLLVLYFAPAALEQKGIVVRDLFYGHDPVFRLAMFGVCVVAAVSIVRLLTASEK